MRNEELEKNGSNTNNFVKNGKYLVIWYSNVLCVGGNRWQKEILTWWPEGRKRKRKIRNEVRKGKRDETKPPPKHVKTQNRQIWRKANEGR